MLDIARAEGLDATVAHGSVTNVQARSFGRLTLRLSGDDAAAAAGRVVVKLNEFTESEVIR